MLKSRGLITLSIVTLTLILCVGIASAELYKWTDANGRQFYSDVAPSSGKAELLDVKVNANPNSQRDPVNTLATSEAEKKNAKAKKIVMYSATWCGFCKKAKAYFVAEGVSYVEYDIENSRKGRADYKRLKGTGVPIIMIDKERMNGFSKGRFAKMYES
ncbi:MAG: glutaredoxin family protein [Gammaproteobacteria bacterium]|nr:MAG: glutaredoxin family protein [Gammaproteobacteria bacterium]